MVPVTASMLAWRDEGSSVCWARAQARTCGALDELAARKSLLSFVNGVFASAYGAGSDELARSAIVCVVGSVEACWTALC